MSIFENGYFGNSVQAWAAALGLTLLSYLLLRVVAVTLVGRAARLAASTRTEWDDIATEALKGTKGLTIFAISLYAGTTILRLPESVARVLGSLAAIALFIQIGFWTSAGISGWMTRYREERSEEDGAAVMSMNVVIIFARLLLWSLVVLLSLDNVGVDVTALVAGLGIGGVAVALAAQNILGDLFASVSIVVDKPFVLGDFLIVGEHLGSVEQIGMKTTRLRSLSGEQLVLANGDLLNSRIRNYGRMYERRVAFKIGVTYQTPRQRLKEIPDLIQAAVESLGEGKVRFDRSHFQAYGDFAISFETVYYVLSPDYNVYMDCQQAINLAIHEGFEERGIEFAYPTQTLFLVSENQELATGS